ncbi:hypothetical protein PILCRDRAFT_812963 [Piloderma croceum F 1598]|uniref:Uncharacterized protein n=1 Tax=Piloderma croceum (strain F 1598) TaxID=765440 RepID=A0A0C3FXN1_PILCF|nr:hypothetical protein PILCRDRAFT_812963 [Piloderma croceum F 1598]
MNRFASVENDSQQLLVVKHNLEYGVRECEELLQSRPSTDARFESDSGSITSVDSG